MCEASPICYNVVYTEAQLDTLTFGDIMHAAENTNIELTPNDMLHLTLLKNKPLKRGNELNEEIRGSFIHT